MLRKCGFINFLIHSIGQTISACAWNLPASDSSHVVLHLVHGMKPYTHQLLSSRMKSDSDCKTSLGKLSASSCWSQKKKKMQCMAIHRSGLLLGGMQGGSCRAPCAMSYPDLVFSTTAESAGHQSRGSFLWLLHGYIVPIWLRCQPATRDQPSCYCDRSVIFCFLFFPVAWSALSREIIASALCQVLIPLKSVTLLQLTSAGPGLK